MITLRDGDLEADWLPEHGMVGASLRHRGGECLGQRGGLDAYLAKGSAFGIPLLAPWANRLDGLRYGDVVLDPARVKLDGGGLPKDGVLAGRTWSVVDTSSTSLTATLTADEPILAVFPFPHTWAVEVTLSGGDTLTAVTTLTATGARPVPVAFGWHPLFQLPDVERAELVVELPVAQEVVIDARGIPTGARAEATWDDGPLGDRTLDAEYDAFGAGGLVLRGGGRELRASFDAAGGYPVGHAWAPDSEPFVAWEPMTAPTNALVSGDGLRHVPPGESLTATFTVRVNAIV